MAQRQRHLLYFAPMRLRFLEKGDKCKQRLKSKSYCRGVRQKKSTRKLGARFSAKLSQRKTFGRPGGAIKRRSRLPVCPVVNIRDNGNAVGGSRPIRSKPQ